MENSILIPSPYTGLTLVKDDKEINVHEVRDGKVYYGLYRTYLIEEDAMPIAMYQLPEEEWITRAGKAILDGAICFSIVAMLAEPELFEGIA